MNSIKLNIFLYGMAIVVGLVFGYLSITMTTFFAEKVAILLAFPVLILLGMLFIYDRYLVFMLIVLFRSSLDPLLDKTKVGSFGLGAVLNALVIFIALLAIFKKNYQLGSLLIKVWAPFLGVLLLSLSYAPDLGHAFKSFMALVSTGAMFALPLVLIRSNDDYNRWLSIILLSSIIPILFGFVDYASGGTVYSDAGKRISSTFNHPNIFGFYLLLNITLAFYIIKSNTVNIPTYIRKVLPFYILLMLVLLLFTKTRSAWIACFAYFVLYGLFYDRKYLLYVFIAPLFMLLIPDVQDRILDMTKGNEVVTYGKLNSYAWRKYLWETGLNWMDSSRYLLGYGLEAFVYYSLDFFPLAGGVAWPAHNAYVTVFFDTGIVGLLAYLWLFSSVFFSLTQFYRQNQFLVFTITILMFQYILLSYSDNMLSYLSFNWYFWLYIGATCSLLFHKKFESVNLEYINVDNATEFSDK